MGGSFSLPNLPARQPNTFHVPPNHAAVLDFSQQSHTPESRAKHELLSRTRGRNTVALVGMGGAGKTTILKEIGHDSDIWARYPDGIWFISLGQDATVSKLMTQLEELVREACPQFLDDFLRMSATDKSPTVLLQKFLDQLKDQNILLIFDDVWDVSDTLYALLKEFCAAVRKLPSASLKLLTSTRDHGVARIPLHDVQIFVIPDASDTETAKRILCRYPNVQPSALNSLSTESKDALENIVKTCAGLPLALSVAGTSVLREMDQLPDGSKDAAWIRYWDALQHNVQQLGETESLEHLGLYASLQSSLNVAEQKWKVETVCLTKLFQSLSVLQKQSSIPLTTLQHLWGLSHKDVKHGMNLLIEGNIASAATVGESTNAALAVHDLVHDYAVHLTEGDEVQTYHASLVDQFYSTSESPTSTPKWQKLSEEAYMSENIVYHMLGARRGTDALRLLTDYSWIQCVNNDEKRVPFRKIMSDLAMLRDYIERNDSSDNRGTVVKDIETLIATMHKCAVPFCMNNRREYSFQLFGRLASLRSDSSVIRRVMWGIEVHSNRPWVRAGAGVLNSVDSELKRLLATQVDIFRMDLGVEENELVIGGFNGKVRVIGCNDGEELCILDGHNTPVMGICIDRRSGDIYSCSADGTVNVWKNTRHRSFKLKLETNEFLLCAVLLPTRRVLAVGSSSGNVRFVEATSGRVLKCVNAHSDRVWALAVGSSENVSVSGSYDHTLRVWDVDTWTANGEALTGHTGHVYCVALSADERIIASGSLDRSVRLWSVQDRRQVCQPLIGHKYAVLSIVFSRDANLLYSAGRTEIIVWDMKSVSNGVSMIHRFDDSRMSFPLSIVLNKDESQLFLGDYNYGNVFVWDTTRVGDANSRGAEDSFVSDIRAFGISCDDSFMALFNRRSEEIEVRKVEDVAEGKGDVIKFKPDHHVYRVAVCSGGGLVAYCGFPELTVFIVDISSGETVHTFLDVEDWAETLENREGMFLKPRVYRLHFDAEGTVLSAEAFAQPEFDEERVKKSISWNVKPSTMRDQIVVENDQESANAIRNSRSRLFCNLAENFVLYSGAVQMEHNNSTSTVATLDHTPWEVSYSPATHRFWASKKDGGLQYVQLVAEDTKLEEWDEPQLPALSKTTSTGTQRQSSDRNNSSSKRKKKGKVFISHAGPDKDTIGQVVYDKLIELGFEVFFDREELKPGQNAPKKMDEEMESASIAVVILSPEFPARKWTMRELLCFLQRFVEYGERGVIIIPVFYRLGLGDIGDIKTLLALVDETGANAFDNAGYWEREVKEGGSLKHILEALQALGHITGIENKSGATNGKGEEERKKRMEIIELIVAAVVGAQKRIDDGSAAGPGNK